MPHISAPSPPFLPDAYDSHSKSLYLLLFLSSSHPHTLTSSSCSLLRSRLCSFLFLPDSLFFFSRCFSLRRPVPLDAIAADAFITMRGTEESATPHHVTLSLHLHPSVWIHPPQHSEMHRVLLPCQVDHLFPSLLLWDVLSVELRQSLFNILS